MSNQEKQAYLLERIKVNESTQCWELQKGIGHAHGYGMTKYGLAHRASYEAFVGPIGLDEQGKTLHVCHACDNKHCINPEHLWLGTHAKNMADRDAKGRHGMLCKPGTMLGKMHTDEAKAKISLLTAGENNPFYGRNHSEETKAKLRKANTGKKHRQVQCPHCGKTCGINTAKQWHFDKCKQKPSAY